MRGVLYKVVCAICLLLPLSASAAPQKELPNWAPDKTMVKQLGQAVDIDGWVFQPPAGFTPKLEDNTPNLTTYMWSGPMRPNNTKTLLCVTKLVLPDNAPNMSQFTPTVALAGFLKKMKATMIPDLQCTVSQAGRINGRMFIRASWNGTNAAGTKLRSIIYVTQDGKQFALLYAVDTVSEFYNTMPLADTSIQTFRITKPVSK